MCLVSSCSCLYPIQRSQVSSREWRCSWSSADRRCSDYIWVIDNFIAYWAASYIRELTYGPAVLWGPSVIRDLETQSRNFLTHNIDYSLVHFQSSLGPSTIAPQVSSNIFENNLIECQINIRDCPCRNVGWKIRCQLRAREAWHLYLSNIYWIFLQKYTASLTTIYGYNIHMYA